MAQNNQLESTALGSALRGAVDAASLGLAPTIADYLGSEGAGQRVRAQAAADAAQHPYARFGGQLVGNTALALVPGAGISRLPLMGTIGKAIEEVYGNPVVNQTIQGASTGINDRSPEKAALGGVTGALTGAATHAVNLPNSQRFSAPEATITEHTTGPVTYMNVSPLKGPNITSEDLARQQQQYLQQLAQQQATTNSAMNRPSSNVGPRPWANGLTQSLWEAAQNHLDDPSTPDDESGQYLGMKYYPR